TKPSLRSEMPIPKAAVDRYLAEQRETRTWLKNLRAFEVENYLNTIRPAHTFTVPSFRLDQKICFLLGVAYPETMFMSDLGLGKTSVSLELLSYFYNHGFMRRAFVFAPTNELVQGWEDEIKKWGFTLPYITLGAGSSESKWKKLREFTGDGIVIGTYVGIAAMVAKLENATDTNGDPIYNKNGKPKRERKVSDRLLLRLVDRVDGVIFDQSTALGNKDSLSFEVCNELSRDAQIKFSLAGRAFGRDPFILWSQFFLTDRGKALGTSAGMFREAFWRREQHKWGVKWVQRKRRQKLLAERIAVSSIRYAVDECVDLPEKVPPIRRYFHLTAENWTYYDQIRDQIIAARGNYREIESSFLRLRQISSGFVGFIDDDTGERAQVEFDNNPKLDLMLATLDEIPEDAKVVIFHEFTYSGSRICQALTKLGHQHGWLWGGTKDWAGIKAAFNEDPDFRFLVANHRKGGQGLNLQVGNYEFFYESPVSALQRAECEGRIYRTGQKQRT